MPNGAWRIVSKLTIDVVTYCTEASNQKSKYAYRKILFYKKALITLQWSQIARLSLSNWKAGTQPTFQKWRRGLWQLATNEQNLSSFPWLMVIHSVPNGTYCAVLSTELVKIDKRHILVHKSSRGQAPSSTCWSRLLTTRHWPRCALQQTATTSSPAPTVGLVTEYSVAAPNAWNGLPTDLKTATCSTDAFKRRLKTWIFKRAFDWYADWYTFLSSTFYVMRHRSLHVL